MVLTVPLGRVRLDLGLRELARERLDLLLVGAQLEVHAASIRLSLYDMSVITIERICYAQHEQQATSCARPAFAQA